MALQAIRTDHYLQQNLGDDVAFVRAVTAPPALSEVLISIGTPKTGGALVFGTGPGARHTCLAAAASAPVRLGDVFVAGRPVAELFFAGPSTVLVFPVDGDADASAPVWVPAVLASVEPTLVVALSCQSSAGAPGVAGLALNGIPLGDGIPGLLPLELIGGASAAAVTLSSVPAIALRCRAPLPEISGVAACERAFTVLRTALTATDASAWLATPDLFRQQLSALLGRSLQRRVASTMFS